MTFIVANPGFRHVVAVLLVCVCIACQPATAVPTLTQPTATAAVVKLPSTVAPSATPAPVSSAPSPLASTIPAPVASGSWMVYTSLDGNLTLQELTSHSVRELLAASPSEFYDGPTFSPDGSRILFVYSSFGGGNQPVDEIRSIRVDGTAPQRLFSTEHVQPEVFLSEPTYAANGRSVYFTTLNPAVRENKFQIVRGAATGGDWSLVLSNAFLPALSHDGNSMAFVRPNPQTFAGGLWIAWSAL